MHLRWKSVRHQGAYINSSKNIQERYEFALRTISELKRGKHYINFDESVVDGTCSQTYSWERRGNVPGRVIKRTISGLSLLLAVSSDGLVFF